MKSLLLIPVIAAALAAAGCQSHSKHSKPSRAFVVTLSSATPVSFSGHLKVDGKDQSISGTTPAEYKIAAQSISCDLVQGPESGLLTVQVRIDGNPDALELVTASSGPNTAARASFSKGRPWYSPW